MTKIRPPYEFHKILYLIKNVSNYTRHNLSLIIFTIINFFFFLNKRIIYITVALLGKSRFSWKAEKCQLDTRHIIFPSKIGLNTGTNPSHLLWEWAENRLWRKPLHGWYWSAQLNKKKFSFWSRHLFLLGQNHIWSGQCLAIIKTRL